MFSGLKDILHEMMQFGAFGAKSELGLKSTCLEQGMDEFEGRGSLRNEEMKVKNKEVGIGN